MPFDPRNHKSGPLITVPNWKWTWTRICQSGPKGQVRGQNIHAIQNCLLLVFNFKFRLFFSFILYKFLSIVTVLLRGLNDIAAISTYTHLRFLDASNNNLIDLSPLASLTQLLWLKASISLLYCISKLHLWAVSTIHSN